MVFILLNGLLLGCVMNNNVKSEEKLLRAAYVSVLNDKAREYFVYLPRGYYSEPKKKWPVLLFLHGNGERGNGKNELDYVLSHGPIYEAWIQKKDVPFIIISPQLHMFDFDQKGLGYIDNRQPSQIPKRFANGVPPRSRPFATEQIINREASMSDMADVAPLLPMGWEQVEDDLIAILASVKKRYRVQHSKTYLSGLSYGGFGTWFLASKHPEKFAAIAPVVGWGHPNFMEPIAEYKIPVWQFAGGRDNSVKIPYFYAGIDKLRELGHTNVRFTVYEEMGHDAWTRVYASDDFYQWLLGYSLNNN
jgi:predicted peptidase